MAVGDDLRTHVEAGFDFTNTSASNYFAAQDLKAEDITLHYQAPLPNGIRIHFPSIESRFYGRRANAGTLEVVVQNKTQSRADAAAEIVVTQLRSFNGAKLQPGLRLSNRLDQPTASYVVTMQYDIASMKPLVDV